MKKQTQPYQRTEVRQRQIAEAALHLIAEGGLAAFTTRALAARIEISDGTIFRHFTNKQEIVLAAMRRLEEELLLDTLEDTKDALERIERLFRSRANLLGGQHAIGRLVFSDVLVYAAGDQGMAMWRSWRSRTLALVASALTTLQGHKRVRDDIGVPALVRVFLGMMLTFGNQRAVSGGRVPDLETEIDTAWASIELLLGVREHMQ